MAVRGRDTLRPLGIYFMPFANSVCKTKYHIWCSALFPSSWSYMHFTHFPNEFDWSKISFLEGWGRWEGGRGKIWHYHVHPFLQMLSYEVQRVFHAHIFLENSSSAMFQDQVEIFDLCISHFRFKICPWNSHNQH